MFCSSRFALNVFVIPAKAVMTRIGYEPGEDELAPEQERITAAGRGGMAGRAGVARVRSACTGLLLALAVAVALPAPAHAAACDRAEFEAVVQEAASVLTSLNQKNKPAMQDKLRQLRDKRGWTQAYAATHCTLSKSVWW